MIFVIFESWNKGNLYCFQVSCIDIVIFVFVSWLYAWIHVSCLFCSFWMNLCFFFMYIPYSASAPALSMWLLSHVFQKLNSWFCLFCPYHSSKDSWYRCATCKHQRNANKWILVVVHMFYCSPIAVVSCMDRFCTHLFFILFVVVYVYFAYIIAHEFHLIVVHLFYINVMQIDAYFIFFNFFFLLFFIFLFL